MLYMGCVPAGVRGEAPRPAVGAPGSAGGGSAPLTRGFALAIGSAEAPA